jgi:hypothetical protein
MMLREGNMARVGGGRLLKICSISHDVAECVWFDNRGTIRTADYELAALQPIWLSSSVRTLWPEINEMPDAVVERLDALAIEKRRKRFTKPKRSKKLKARWRHTATESTTPSAGQSSHGADGILRHDGRQHA